MSDHEAVALFVRAPVPGRVKTRLAAAIGDEFACRLYRAMVEDVLAQVQACGLPLWLFHDDGAAAALPAEWTAAAAAIRPQVDGDLGERMAAAFADCFAAGIRRVILVGSDIPAIDAGLLLSAKSALDSHDAVFAPTFDGGYCLIGLRGDGRLPRLFRDIPWSTGKVMALSRARCRQLGLTVHLLPTLRDIDTLADLLAYATRTHPHAAMSNAVVAQVVAIWRGRLFSP